VPAHLDRPVDEPVVRPVRWQGSGDLVGVAAAQCFIVLRPERGGLAEGDWVEVMMKD